jgi:hypothetical protein
MVELTEFRNVESGSLSMASPPTHFMNNHWWVQTLFGGHTQRDMLRQAGELTSLVSFLMKVN